MQYSCHGLTLLVIFFISLSDLFLNIYSIKVICYLFFIFCVVMVQPIEALIIVAKANHCVQSSCSFKKIKPENAATAGSKLISVPKLKAVKFLNAIISKEKGNALANTAKAIK